MSVQDQIRQYVAENFLFSSNGFELDNDDSFLESGIVDSLGVLELVTFVEEQFQVKVREDDIIPSNFDSVNRLTAYIASRRN